MAQAENPSQFIIYQTENGKTKLDVRFENETVWLTQELMADLFSTSKQNIGQHLNNIFKEQELTENSVVKDFFTTAADSDLDSKTTTEDCSVVHQEGSRQINRDHFGLVKFNFLT